MDISSMMYELENVNKELDRLKKTVRQLTLRKTALTNGVTKRLQETGESHVLYKGKRYTLKQLTRRTRKAEKKKKIDVLKVLQEAGIQGNDANKMYQALSNAMTGNETVTFKLK